MIVGFTGTQRGMNLHQQQNFLNSKTVQEASEFHHGDCQGADEQAHQLIQTYMPKVNIVIHPPTDSKKRAFCAGEQVQVLTPFPYLERNRAIVDVCDILIATPGETVEQLRSGTWATIHYARKKRNISLFCFLTEW